MKSFWTYVLGISLLWIGLKGFILYHREWWNGIFLACIVFAIGLISEYWNRKEEP